MCCGLLETVTASGLTLCLARVNPIFQSPVLLLTVPLLLPMPMGSQENSAACHWVLHSPNPKALSAPVSLSSALQSSQTLSTLILCFQFLYSQIVTLKHGPTLHPIPSPTSFTHFRILSYAFPFFGLLV
jgi:hypothetical protein